MKISSYKNISNFPNCYARTASIKSMLLYGDNQQKINDITIVIPTYKRTKSLYQAIMSVENQSDKSGYNIIVCDNGNEDNVVNQNLSWLMNRGYVNVRYYRNEKNFGVEGNFNRCIELAETKYVAFLHDDDVLYNDYIKVIRICIKKAERKNKNLGFIVPRVDRSCEIDSCSEKLKKNKKFKGLIWEVRQINSLYSGIGPTASPTCGMIFNRKAIIESGGFNSDFYPSGDYVVGYQILMKGYAGYRTRDVLGIYRTSGNISGSLKMCQNFVKADYYFREFIYNEKPSRKLFGKIFREVQYYYSIKGIQKKGKEMGLILNEKDLNFRKKSKCSFIQRLFFKVLYIFINLITRRYF